MKRHAGLSLLDLTVTMLIIGIVGAVGTMKYAEALTEHRLQSAALVIAEDLRAAQHAARTRSTQVSVMFDKTAESYTISGMPDPEHPTQPFHVDVLQQFGVRVLDSQFNAGNPLVINAFGFVTNPSDGVITLHASNASTPQRTVQVRKGTGAVEVQ